MNDPRSYVLIGPCRNEAKFMRRTLDAIVQQTIKPAKFVIVDDGSDDETPDIVRQYAAKHDFIKLVQRENRGFRKVGGGVIEAFDYGLATIDLSDYAYLCKIDLDLDLPAGYFEDLIRKMEANPRLGTCSGKPYYTDGQGRKISEGCGDEMSVGMTKFFRTECFQDIGGFVRQVMWDAIDCHTARQKGWQVAAFNDDDIAFEHLRPMGSSQKGIHTGRARHGFGQWYMGTGPVYLLAGAVNRMRRPPYITGGLAVLWGYGKAALTGQPQHGDRAFRSFVRDFQRRALFKGKRRAMDELEKERAAAWDAH
ncbi:MAG: glycosyltransferase family 2 protein [Pseudomonadota bacterium]